MKLAYKNWDSQFFGKEIYDLEIESQDSIKTIREIINSKRPGSLYQAQVEITNYKWMDLLLQARFTWINDSIEFSNEQLRAEPDLPKIEQAQAKDLEAIRAIIPILYPHSRYIAQGFFDSSDANRLYDTWIINAYKGVFDDELLILRDSSSLAGFVTLRYSEPNEASIGLIGIDPKNQNKNMGTQLMMAIHNYCLQQGIHKIHVRTQLANHRAIGLYSKLGYQILEIKSWFYKMI